MKEIFTKYRKTHNDGVFDAYTPEIRRARRTIVRFLRTPEYDQLFSGDPTWVTESIGGIGQDGRPLVTRTSYRYLQTLRNLGPAPEPNLTILWFPRLPEPFKRFRAALSIETSSIQYESDELMRPRFGDDTAIACCVSAAPVGKQMQFFGARVNLAKTLAVRHQRRPRRTTGEQAGPSYPALTGDRLDYEEVAAAFDRMTPAWPPPTSTRSTSSTTCMTSTPTERIEMALHDYPVKRTLACGIAGLAATADSLSAIKHANVTVIRDRPAWP